MRVKASQVLRGIVATLLVCGAVLSAQSLPPGQGRIYVAVNDATGRPAEPRDAEAFHVWENDVVRPVVSAGAATVPPSIVVIVHGFAIADAGDVRKALTGFVTQVRAAAPNARLAIVGEVTDPKFSHITNNAAALDETARRFAESGKNMVYFEAIVDAAKALGKEVSDRRVIVSLTKNTRHDADHQTMATTVEALKKSMASVWCIDVTPEGTATDYNTKSSTEMDSFIDHAPSYSGGTVDHLFGFAALGASLTRLTTTMLAQQQVTFTRTDQRGESTLRIGVAGKPGEQVIGPAWFVK